MVNIFDAEPRLTPFSGGRGGKGFDGDSIAPYIVATLTCASAYMLALASSSNAFSYSYPAAIEAPFYDAAPPVAEAPAEPIAAPDFSGDIAAPPAEMQPPLPDDFTTPPPAPPAEAQASPEGEYAPAEADLEAAKRAAMAAAASAQGETISPFQIWSKMSTIGKFHPLIFGLLAFFAFRARGAWPWAFFAAANLPMFYILATIMSGVIATQSTSIAVIAPGMIEVLFIGVSATSATLFGAIAAALTGSQR